MSRIGPAAVSSDGRLASQLRPISVDSGMYPTADGSVKLRQGQTTVIATVSGPKPNKTKLTKLMRIDQATLIVSVTPASTVHSSRESLALHNHLSTSIQNSFKNVIALHLYPQTIINISILVINEDGSLLSTCINAACIALLYSGIDCISMVASVTMIMRNNEFVLDPNAAEESHARITDQKQITIAFVNGVSEEESGMVLYQSNCSGGEFSMESLDKSIAVGKRAVAHVLQFIRQSFTKTIT